LNQQKNEQFVDSSSFSHALRACCPTTEDTATTPTHRQIKFSEMAIVVAQRVWKGLQQRHHEDEGSKTTRGEDHLSDLLGDTITTTTTTSSTVEFQSYHFVHMLRVGRNYFILLENDSTTATTKKKLYKEHHLEFVTTALQECFEKRKVNIFVVQELVHHAVEITKRSSESDGGDEIQWLTTVLMSLPNLSKHDQHELQTLLDQFSSKRKQATSRSPGRIAKSLLQRIPAQYKATNN
jgi:hypothetical protein